MNPTSQRPSPEPVSPAIAAAAAQWLARRDRGLTALEQDDYMEWLHADPRHAGAMAQHAAALERMMGLSEWQPALSSTPNPDLFAPPVRRRRILWFRTLAAAAAAAFGAVAWWLVPAMTPDVPVSHLQFNQRRMLADGSMVELRDGSAIDVKFTQSERRVRLRGGEAHFNVTRNPERPFTVEAGGVAVRAVGTAFNVRMEGEEVAVLVTHGKVVVSSPTTAAPVALSVGEAAKLSMPVTQPAGRTAPPAAAIPVITRLSPAQVQSELAWQVPRLQFHETSLSDAVHEFNRHGGGRRLIVGDADLGLIPIGGTFRVDNPEGFVRLLEITIAVRGDELGDGTIVLRRVH